MRRPLSNSSPLPCPLADAPVAPQHFPYNRCRVWACAACGRGFVQYTEYGGYYVDHRLRQIDPARVV